MSKRTKLGLVVFLILSTYTFFSPPPLDEGLVSSEQGDGGEVREATLVKKKVDLSPLRSLVVKEIAAYKGEVSVTVTDLWSSETIAIDGDEIFFPASSIKALILAKTLQDVGEDRYSLGSVDSLLSSMMNVSSNYAANTLMLKIGVDRLEAFPAEMGLRNTTFIHGFSDGNPNVPRVRYGANATTSNDTNLFWQKLYTRQFLNEELTKKALEYAKTPTARLIYVPQGVLVYHKPGYIGTVSDETYIDAGIVQTDKFAYAVSYFSRKNPTHAAGADFGSSLTKIIYEWFSQSYK